MDVQKNMKIKSYVGCCVSKANTSATESKTLKRIPSISFKKYKLPGINLTKSRQDFHEENDKILKKDT